MKDGREHTHCVEGQLFYGSIEDFMNSLDCKEALAACIASRILAKMKWIHVLGQRESQDTHDHSGKMRLGT